MDLIEFDGTYLLKWGWIVVFAIPVAVLLSGWAKRSRRRSRGCGMFKLFAMIIPVGIFINLKGAARDVGRYHRLYENHNTNVVRIDMFGRSRWIRSKPPLLGSAGLAALGTNLAHLPDVESAI